MPASERPARCGTRPSRATYTASAYIQVQPEKVVGFVRKRWKGAGKILRKICLVDRLLMLFMLILLLYTACRLFVGENISADSDAVDVIVRTSIASVFGYFISSNFAKTESSLPSSQKLDAPVPRFSATSADADSDGVQEPIDFQTSSTDAGEALDEVAVSENPPPSTHTCSKMQILVVSGIGFVSLVILFLAGYLSDTTPAVAATLSQLRDFVAACIGFLISCGKNTTG